MAADPATLIPFEDSQPIIVGRDHEGSVSQDGSRTVIQTLLSDGSFLVTVVETGTNEVLSSVGVDAEPQLLTVAEDGTAYWLDDTTGDLVSLEVGADAVSVTTDNLPATFAPNGDHIELLDGNRIGLVGSHPVDDGRLLSVFVIEPDGATASYDLPNVETQIDDDTGVIVQPGYAWDHDNNRVLVVEATRDVVRELDLDSGEVTEHPWDGLGPATTRDVVLSGDGTRLFIASANQRPDGEDLVRTPQNLIVLDPVDWASGEIVDITVDHLYLSPDGATLLAQGAEVTSSPSETAFSPSPVYLVDMTTAETVVAFEVSDTIESSVQYSTDGAYAYLTTDEAGAETYAILDVTRQELVGTAGFNRFSLIGPAGLVAFHQQ